MALFVYNIKCAYIYAYVKQEKMYIHIYIYIYTHTETHTHTQTKIPSQEALGNEIQDTRNETFASIKT